MYKSCKFEINALDLLLNEIKIFDHEWPGHCHYVDGETQIQLGWADRVDLVHV